MGAQGGTSYGGRGGYSTGVVFLQKGEEIYVVAGSSGGGWYDDRNSAGTGRNTNVATGRESGYIGNSLLISHNEITKVMDGYNVE